MIRVAVADDQELVRAGILVLLRSAPDVAVAGEAADGAAAVELARRTGPDVVLMDVRMPGVDGIEATRRIVAAPGCAGTRVLMLTTFDDDELVHAALRAGASGFLLKDTPPAELLHALRVVAAGEALLAPTVTRRLIARFVATAAPRPDGLQLTERENEVLLAVAGGLSNREIADALHMGYATGKTHVSHLLAKLGARDRAQLVMYAYESGRAVPGRS